MKKEESELMQSVLNELEKLRRIVDIIKSMDYGEKERTMNYLTSRFDDYCTRNKEN